MRLALPLRAVAWLVRRLPPGDIAALTPVGMARARRPPQDLPGARLIVGSLEPGVSVDERRVPGAEGPLVVQVYRSSRGQSSTSGRRPLIVYFHGGGWVVGNAASAQWLCSGVAAETGAVVASVEYRLAPEHPFPAAVLDCLAATRHFADHPDELGIDPERIAVMGDSAGGNLATVVCLLARDGSGPGIAAQVLIYPATDATLSSPSVSTLLNAPMLSRRDIDAYRAHYLGRDGDPTDPRISPLLAADHAGLPPALIQTAEHDPLVDDGRRYAQALRAAGVAVRYTGYLGVPHGFVSLSGVTRIAHQARAEIVEYLRSAFAEAE